MGFFNIPENEDIIDAKKKMNTILRQIQKNSKTIQGHFILFVENVIVNTFKTMKMKANCLKDLVIRCLQK